MTTTKQITHFYLLERTHYITKFHSILWKWVAGCHPQVMFNVFFYKARVEYKGSYKEYVNKWGITFLPESN